MSRTRSTRFGVFAQALLLCASVAVYGAGCGSVGTAKDGGTTANDGGGTTNDGGTKPTDGGPVCTPTTCSAQGKDCGSIPNGCGGTLDCGTTCPTGQTCGGGGISNVCGSQSTGGFVVSSALSLSATSITAGQTLTGTVTYENTSTAAITVQAIVIACRPPGGTHAGGPYDDLQPTATNVTVQPGKTTTVTATRAFTANDPTGQWYCYPTFQSAAGTWTDGSEVNFTVTTAACTATTCSAQGKDCGTISDGCGGTLNCGANCPTPGDTCGGGGVANVCGSTPSGTLAIRVSGNHLVNAAGNVVQLRGVNVGGLEATAIEGWATNGSSYNYWGDFSTTGEPDWSTILTWHVNAVRLPLNEASWLGLTCKDYASGTAGNAKKADPGYVAGQPSPYQAEVVKSVNDANAAGLYVILDLHWAAPGDICPQSQDQMADHDHSDAFWTSVANTFKSNPAVMFELFNEPYMWQVSDNVTDPWAMLMSGGANNDTFKEFNPNQNATFAYTWQLAPMQEMLDAVRATGATNVVLVGTNSWCGDLSKWLQYEPTDSLNQMAAAWHAYPGNNNEPAYNTVTDQYVAAEAIAKVVPVVITETGDHNAAGTVGSPFDSIVLPWADSKGISYLGWCWDPWNLPDDVLIKDLNGTPTDGWGQYFHDHLACVAAGNSPCP